MNIHLDCPGCGRTLRVNQQFSGRTVRCPSCGTAYKAPAPRDVRPTPKRIEWEDFPAEELYAPCEGCGVLVRGTRRRAGEVRRLPGRRGAGNLPSCRCRTV